jgi:site-specific DNA-methyltransferase (adenine-specific)
MTYQAILGECVSELRKMPDDSIDVCIMDPPYEAETHTKVRRSLPEGGFKNTPRGHTILSAPIARDFAQMSETLRADVCREVARVTMRWVVAFCQIEAVGLWKDCFVDAGLQFVRGGIWIKPNGAPQFTGDRPGHGFESIAIAHRPGRKRWNGGGKHGVWTHNLEMDCTGRTKAEHPTIKPINLMLELVRDFSDPGETILDPFMGSGSTGVAALRLGRHFVGIEQIPKYHALASDRLRAESLGSTLKAQRTGQLPLLGGV